MSSLAAIDRDAPPLLRKHWIRVKATRPAIVDLRFREDAWVIADAGGASVCLGEYRLTGLSATGLDLPALNTLLNNVRVGQARRHQSGRRPGR